MAAHQGSPPAQPCRLRFECSRRSSVAVGRGAAAGAAARSPSCLPFAPASLASVRRSRAARCAAAPGPIVVIDNYDSFTYNLVQYLWDEGAELLVVRNDEKTCAEIAAMQPAGILVGPGPGAPEESGIALQACRELGPRFPLLGVCMGLQCIGAAFGGRVVRSPTGLMHGKQSPVLYDLEDEGGLLHGLPNPFLAGRYHSLAIERDSFPEAQLKVTAWVADGTIMGVRHRAYPWIQGVQFHPESIITENGKLIIRNWLQSLPRDTAEMRG